MAIVEVPLGVTLPYTWSQPIRGRFHCVGYGGSEGVAAALRTKSSSTDLTRLSFWDRPRMDWSWPEGTSTTTTRKAGTVARSDPPLSPTSPRASPALRLVLSLTSSDVVP